MLEKCVSLPVDDMRAQIFYLFVFILLDWEKKLSTEPIRCNTHEHTIYKVDLVGSMHIQNVVVSVNIKTHRKLSRLYTY